MAMLAPKPQPICWNRAVYRINPYGQPQARLTYQKDSKIKERLFHDVHKLGSIVRRPNIKDPSWSPLSIRAELIEWNASISHPKTNSSSCVCDLLWGIHWSIASSVIKGGHPLRVDENSVDLRLSLPYWVIWRGSHLNCLISPHHASSHPVLYHHLTSSHLIITLFPWSRLTSCRLSLSYFTISHVMTSDPTLLRLILKLPWSPSSNLQKMVNFVHRKILPHVYWLVHQNRLAHVPSFTYQFP